MPIKRSYFDYAATTPVDPRVRRAMLPYFSARFGNAGSVHSFGQETLAAVDAARETIARSVGVEFREVIFTGSATEANNLALRGVVSTHQRITNSLRICEFVNSSPIRNSLILPRIVVSAVEHDSVLNTARDLERSGEIELVVLPVNKNGVVNLKKLEGSLTENTVLVSIMYANNETGVIQPISEISEVLRNFRAKSEKGQAERGLSSRSPLSALRSPLFHTDAAQAFQFLDCNIGRLGVDLMTLSGHKIYGPKGVGALIVGSGKRKAESGKSGTELSALRSPLSAMLTGGGQEFGLRSGTENVPAIVGFGKAVQLADRYRERETKRISDLRNLFLRELNKFFPRAQLNGISSTNNESVANLRIRKFGSNSLFVDVLPNILNVYFPGHDAQDLLIRLDLAGIAVSAGPACSARSLTASHVLLAMGHSPERAKNSLRFSFGRTTTTHEIRCLLYALKRILVNPARERARGIL
ncbi:MAG: cysteine desulfurase [Candidatus Liptonbacteria bacterium]|nr:cysteine desulfurase [Candidatus Liptonbacteria bacterium]